MWSGSYPKISVVVPRDVYIKPDVAASYLATEKVAFHQINSESSLNYLSNSALMQQVVQESLQAKTPFWKQTGIYCLEFFGAGTATCASFSISRSLFPWNLDPDSYDDFLKAGGTYVVLNTFLSSSSTLVCGKMLNQKGSWHRAAIGAGIGSLINTLREHGVKSSYFTLWLTRAKE